MVNTGKEYRISRNELDRTILLGILAVEVIQMADSLFDRAAFIEKVRNTFKPLEASLPDGDAFDYEEAALFSGIVNGSQEHVVVVPLTQASLSFEVAKHLGEKKSWENIGTLPLFGFYMLSPTDCIHTLQPDTPYLARGIGWDRAEMVDAEGRIPRLFMTWWRRGEPTPAYYKYSGNIEVHLETCTTSGSNQV